MDIERRTRLFCSLPTDCFQEATEVLPVVLATMIEDGEILSKSRCFILGGHFFKVAIASSFGQQDILIQEVDHADCFKEEDEAIDSGLSKEVGEYFEPQ